MNHKSMLNVLNALIGKRAVQSAHRSINIRLDMQSILAHLARLAHEGLCC